MFSKADAYERFMGRWSRLLGPALITFADVRDGDTVLDVGSGTGSLALSLRTRFPSIRIMGIDPAQSFVDHATRTLGSANIQFEVGDAQQLDLPDATIDKALSALVLNFVPDPARAVREMMRVTKPGGILAAAVWDYGVGGMQMLRTFWDEAVALDPAIAARDEANMQLCREGALVELWKLQGMTNVQPSQLMAAVRFASFDDYWSPFLLGQGPAGAHVGSLSNEQQSALEQRLRKRILGDGPDQPFEMPARAWAVKGTVP